jgi:hypothetical protein
MLATVYGRCDVIADDLDIEIGRNVGTLDESHIFACRADLGENNRLAIDLELESFFLPRNQYRAARLVDDRPGLTDLHAVHVETGIAAADPVDGRGLVTSLLSNPFCLFVL